MSSDQLQKLYTEAMDVYAPILKAQNDGENAILVVSQEKFNTALAKEGIQDRPTLQAPSFLSLVPTVKEGRANLNALKTDCDDALVTLKAKYDEEVNNRLDKIYKSYCSTNNATINSKLKEYTRTLSQLKDDYMTYIYNIDNLGQIGNRGIIKEPSIATPEFVDQFKRTFEAEYLKTIQSSIEEVQELNNRAIAKEILHEQYKGLLEETATTLSSSLLIFNDALNQEISNLEATKPSPDSTSGKQLAELKSAQIQLSTLVTAKQNTKDIDGLYNKADAVKKIGESLNENFQKIGYPGTIRKVLNTIVKGLAALCNAMFKTKIKISEAIDKSKTDNLVKFSSMEDNVKFNKLSENRPTVEQRPEHGKPRDPRV